MGVHAVVELGWFVIINEDDDIIENQDILVYKHDKPEWEDFLIGTDPICGTNNHYCVFNRNNLSRGIDLYDHTVISFRTDFKIPTEPPAEIQEFIDAYKESFGEDSIKLDYGIIAYSH